MISEEGYRDAPIGIEAIIGYYRASIRDFSRKAKPLYDLLSTPVTTKSKEKYFQNNQKVKNHPVNRLIGQTNTKVFQKI